MAELEAACGRLAAPRISDAALDDLEQANATCEAAVEAADSDGYYRENERFHHIIYAESGNSFLQNDVIRLHKRLKPFRRIQLQLRGRLSQSMAEHRAIVAALAAGDAIAAGEALRSHVAVQGEKFHHVLASMQKVAE